MTLRGALAPSLVYSENLPFQIFPDTVAGRSAYANPFHGRASSIDLPLRFGDEPLRRLDYGRTGLSVETARFSAGFTTENEWWGPGIRNALVMSNNAPGIPRAFLTLAPVRTRAS